MLHLNTQVDPSLFSNLHGEYLTRLFQAKRHTITVCLKECLSLTTWPFRISQDALSDTLVAAYKADGTLLVVRRRQAHAELDTSLNPK